MDYCVVKNCKGIECGEPASVKIDGEWHCEACADLILYIEDVEQGPCE